MSTPVRVRVLKRVTSDFSDMLDNVLVADPGEYDGGMNQHGAVWVNIGKGRLGVKPGEFELVSGELPVEAALRARVAELEAACLAVERAADECCCSYDPCGCGRRCGDIVYDVLHDEFGHRRAALSGAK